MDKKIILIDMDGVVADFSAKLLKTAKERGYGEVDPSNVKSFKIHDEFPEKFHEGINNIISERGFYRDLKPIDGAIEGIQEMMEYSFFEVFFCTSPWNTSETCIRDKQNWLSQYFGKKILKRLVVTNDKTLVRGDYLIDDKPTIKGVFDNPTWEQILFSQPYNEKVIGKRRMFGWKDWKKIFINDNNRL